MTKKHRRILKSCGSEIFTIYLTVENPLILGGITLGILNIFFVNPYMYLSHAELYHALKYNGARPDAGYDAAMSL